MPVAKKTETVAVIRPANFMRTTIGITGTAPYVQNKFSYKALTKMMEDMQTPKSAKKAKTDRPPRDFSDDFVQCQHITVTGWHGIPCAAFRMAMIDACRTVSLVMTRTKMAVMVIADGFDKDDGTSLVRLKAGPPQPINSHVRNDNGSCDIRVRAQWREWAADVTLEFDADMITPESVVNLLDRAGRQVGVGEGRPYSKDSVGQGWGTFTVNT